MRRERLSNCANRRNEMKAYRLIVQFICAVIACLWLSGCHDDCEDNVLTNNNQLLVMVSTNSTKAGTGVIRGNYLPSGATLGVTLRPTDGGNLYDNKDYTNFLYTASGSETSQQWTPEVGKPILLSEAQATAYAYFPRQADVTDITKVPITNESETDYMYSAPEENISKSNLVASFRMSHVMSVVRVNVIKGNYNGVGAIDSVSISGQTAATSAKLNVMDGSLTDIIGSGASILKIGPWTFSTIGQLDFWAVPTGEPSKLQFTIGIDDYSMITTSEELQLLPGKIYCYTLIIDSKEMKISSVSVMDRENLPSIDQVPHRP